MRISKGRVCPQLVAVIAACCAVVQRLGSAISEREDRSMRVRMIGVAALLVLCVEGCATPEPRAPRTQPADGVGFRLVNHWDHSRPYRTSRAPDGTPLDLPSGRPLQIAMWYPAVIGDLPPLTVADYTRLSATENTLQPVTEEWARAARAYLLSDPFIDVDSVEARLASTVMSRWDAPSASGSFPIVVYAPGSSASWHDNYALAETLAAEGYIVLATRSRGLRHPDMSLDVNGIESEVRDLEQLYETAISLPGADPTRVAAIGRSWGAVAAVVFAHRNHQTDALVSLDGTISYNMDQLLEAYPHLPRGEELSVPSMIAVGLRRSSGATAIDRTHYFDEVTQVDVHHVDYADLPHGGFSSGFLDRYYRDVTDPDKIESARAIVGSYDRMVADVVQFLDSYVKSEPSAPAWFGDEARTVDSRLNGPRLPGFDDFSRTVFDFGLDTAVELYEETLATDPEHRMFNVWTLNRIIAEFAARGDYETAEAFAAFALDRYEDKAVLHVTRGRARYLAGHADGAQASFDAALALDAGNREATLLKALLLEREARP